MTKPQPDTETVFLVSGGAKGITARCVVEVARRYRCGFVLVGRSPFAGEGDPPWAEGVEAEAALKQRAMEHLAAQGERPTPRQVQRVVRGVRSRREIAATLAAIAEAGGRAVYLSADVTDRAALAEGLAGAESQLAPVTGIIHGAGLLADKLIQHKSAEDFERVVGVKVGGLENLLACVPPERLDYLVLFSSVAGFYGNAGQADYAIANEILNKVAHHVQRQHPACRVLAIDWGPWDGGMVTPALKALLAERDIDVIPVDAGTAFLAEALAAETPPQLVVGSSMPAPPAETGGALRRYRLRRALRVEDNPFLRDHVIGGHAVLPTVCAVAWMVNACENLYPGYTFFRVEDYKALKGLVFDGQAAEDYVLDLEEVAKSDEAIVFDGLIRSETAEGKPRYHYSARVTLRPHSIAAQPPAPDLPAPDHAARNPMDGARLYADGTLFHGPSFRGIERVLAIGPEGLTMRCALPSFPPEQQGQFPAQSFNPYLTDVQLQSLLVWAKHTYGYGGLPLRIASGELYRPVSFGETTYATLVVRNSTSRSLVADVAVHDEAGRLCSLVTGAEITLSPRLNALFQQNQLS